MAFDTSDDNGSETNESTETTDNTESVDSEVSVETGDKGTELVSNPESGLTGKGTELVEGNPSPSPSKGTELCKSNEKTESFDTSSVDATKDKTEANDEKSDSGRTPVESEKKTETMLDNESNDYTHQTILDENLHTLSKREAGSIAPDHMAAYDKDGNVIKGDDYSTASHFEVVEDKNYSIEKTSGRSNLVQNICEQAENRNNALSVNGATVHQTYRIDVSGHENVSLQQLDALYDNLNSRLPNNVDVEFVLN